MLFKLPDTMNVREVEGSFKNRGKVFEAITLGLKTVNGSPFQANTLYLPLEAVALLNRDKGSQLLLQSVQQMNKLRVVAVQGLIPIVLCYIPLELEPPEHFIGFPSSFNREHPDSLCSVVPSKIDYI